MRSMSDDEQEAKGEASPLDHLFSALKHFARATTERPARGDGSASRAGANAGPRFGAAVKKSCCLAQRSK